MNSNYTKQHEHMITYEGGFVEHPNDSCGSSYLIRPDAFDLVTFLTLK